jgi:hypothetical protein
MYSYAVKWHGQILYSPIYKRIQDYKVPWFHFFLERPAARGGDHVSDPELLEGADVLIVENLLFVVSL